MTECNSATCKYHELTESVIKDLKSSVGELVKGQTEMRESFIQLTEAFKMVERLEAKIDKIEEERKEEKKSLEKKVEDNTMFVIRVSAIVGAISFIVPILSLGYVILKSFVGG